MKPKAKKKTPLSQFETVGRLIILQSNAEDIALVLQTYHDKVVALADQIRHLREDLKIKIEFK